MDVLLCCRHCQVPVSLSVDEFRDRFARSEKIAAHDKGNILMLCEHCSIEHIKKQYEAP